MNELTRATRPQDVDSVIHAPKRLIALSILNAVKEIEFSSLRDRLEIRDSDLSKQMATLHQAGMIDIRKTGGGRTSKTWYSLTDEGRDSFLDYRQALIAVLGE